MVEVRRQLSVYLQNKPGELANLTRLLSDRGINIEGLTVADTVDHAVDRLIVDDPDAAKKVLQDQGVFVVDTDVLAFDLENKPGALADLTERLAEHDINIEYAYYTASPQQRRGFNIIKVSQPEEALELLQDLEP